MTAAVRELTCREVADFLADYVAGDLGGEARSLFEAHLAECPDCVEYLRGYVATMRLTREAYEVAAAVGVPERLVRAIVAARACMG